MKEKYVKKFLGNGYGLPNFQYRDEYQKRVAGYWDKVYYFKSGTFIEYNGEKLNIQKNIPNRGCVEVGVGGDARILYYDEISVLNMFDVIKELIK